jgi:glycosyltransferase involved in cell wall biosynthesis
MNDTFSIIILTFNEERNILACLESVVALNAQIFIVDSGSTDKTIEICKQYTSNIFSHPFENYGLQRNWALNNLPIASSWVLNIDADHRVTPQLSEELTTIFNNPIDPQINGFLVTRKTMFLDKWIKHGGHYPTYHAVLFRVGFGKCEEKLYDQHFLVNGKVVILTGDMIDIIAESISSFIIRHNQWANLEAKYQFDKKLNTETDVVKPKLFGNPIERRRYIKKVYEGFPLFVRPSIYFFIRYFL